MCGVLLVPSNDSCTQNDVGSGGLLFRRVTLCPMDNRLKEQKDALEKRLEAIKHLEDLDPDQLAAIRELLCDTPEVAPGRVTCPVCGESFQRNGIKRHISNASVRDAAHKNFRAAEGAKLGGWNKWSYDR